MIETHAGLPNTCHDCGEPQTETWFATSVDAAIAGGGICAPCKPKREDGVAVDFSATLETQWPPAKVAEVLAASPPAPDPVAAETPVFVDDPAVPRDDPELGPAKTSKASKGPAKTSKASKGG